MHDGFNAGGIIPLIAVVFALMGRLEVLVRALHCAVLCDRLGADYPLPTGNSLP
jgi:hypothetical protein